MGSVAEISQGTEGIAMNDVIARYLDCWNETDPASPAVAPDRPVWPRLRGNRAGRAN
jgi:hypothetical protein